MIGSNNLAAGLALGALGQVERTRRIVAALGVFESCVPLVGLALGRTSTRVIERQASWVRVVLLIAVGMWMLWTTGRNTSKDEQLARRTTWDGPALLSAGLSIGNPVVGFSLGLRAYDPLTIAALEAILTVRSGRRFCACFLLRAYPPDND